MPIESLSQSARLKQLNTARWILIVVGLLSMAVNAFMAFNPDMVLESELKKQGIAREQVPEEAWKEVRGTVQMAGAIFTAAGLAFLLFGVFIKKAPVPLTIAGLALYVTSALAVAALDPASLAKGALFKILIIVGLAKSVGAALAYEKERKAAAGDSDSVVGDLDDEA